MRECRCRENGRSNWNNSASEGTMRNHIMKMMEPGNGKEEKGGSGVQARNEVVVESQMPVVKGWLGGKEVDVLRDTGCSSAAVRADLVDESKRMGTEVTCTLIDGTETFSAGIHICEYTILHWVFGGYGYEEPIVRPGLG